MCKIDIEVVILNSLWTEFRIFALGGNECFSTSEDVRSDDLGH